jgi:hypothetical protein
VGLPHLAALAGPLPGNLPGAAQQVLSGHNYGVEQLQMVRDSAPELCIGHMLQQLALV